MSVTRGGSAETYEPVMNIDGEDARLVSGPEQQKHVLDHAPDEANEDNGNAARHEIDAADVFPFLGRFDDKIVAVNEVMVHIEGGDGADYIYSVMYRNNENRNPRLPGSSDGPEPQINPYDHTAQFEFYTGASDFDSGGSDTGSLGDGHQYAHSWTVQEPHQYLFSLGEDDSVGFRTGIDAPIGNANAKWRLSYGVYEYLD